MKKWGVSENYAGIGHCILGYAAQEPAPAKPRKADFIVRVDSNRMIQSPAGYQPDPFTAAVRLKA